MEFFELDVKKWLRIKYEDIYTEDKIEKITLGITSLPYMKCIGVEKYKINEILPIETH